MRRGARFERVVYRRKRQRLLVDPVKSVERDNQIKFEMERKMARVSNFEAKMGAARGCDRSMGFRDAGETQRTPSYLILRRRERCGRL